MITDQDEMCFTFAISSVEKVAKATTVTELSGIRMAEIRGVNKPAAAKEIPMML